MNTFQKIYCRTYQLGFRIALPFLPYRIPGQLSTMSEVADLLIKEHKSAILLVADATVRSLGLTENLERELKDKNIEFSVYEQKTPNPTIADVEAAREEYLKINAQAIIAVGGGSAMDCAKVTGARIAKPNTSIKKMKGVMKILKKTPLFIAIPTTAGTGSEVTLAAVITDGEKHHKYPINDFNLIPDYAVLDPELTLKLPAFITATTGLDALTHAVEAYIGNSTTKFTRAMSEEAVAKINNSLETAVNDGMDIEARREMLQAAFCAGASFTRSYVGYVHGIAHSLGGKYGVAHGLANAVILPVMLREYGKTCEKKLAVLARKSGVIEEGLSDEITADRFISWIENMNLKFGVPKGFSEIMDEDIDEMASHAAHESNPLYPVPKLMNKEELSQIYRKLKL